MLKESEKHQSRRLWPAGVLMLSSVLSLRLCRGEEKLLYGMMGGPSPSGFVGAHIAEKAMQGIPLMLGRHHWCILAECGDCEAEHVGDTG